MKHKRIAVLRGGPSEEYPISMQTGAAVLAALEELHYPYKDIVITKKGEWLDAGRVKLPKDALDAVDTVFIALHGAYGEDGGVQKLLQNLNIPFTGSGALSSAISFNKTTAKNTLKDTGILMPKHRQIISSEISNIDALVRDLNRELGSELFLKPVASGSSHGAAYAPTEAITKSTLEQLLQSYEAILVEEFIRGREATVAVLDAFRDEDFYTLPVIEIIPPGGAPLFSLENKYNGTTSEICPGRFSYHEKAKLADIARLVHTELQCRHYSRSDFIVRNGDVYFLEINTLPGLTGESLVPKAAAAVGLSFNELIEHLLTIAHR